MKNKAGEINSSLSGSFKDGGKLPISPVSSYQGGSDRRLSTVSMDSTLGDVQMYSDETELTNFMR